MSEKYINEEQVKQKKVKPVRLQLPVINYKYISIPFFHNNFLKYE